MRILRPIFGLGSNWIAVALAAIVVVGCGSSSSEFMSEDQKDQERATEIQALSWPSNEPMPSFDGLPSSQHETMFQKGFGQTEADQAWFCAWSKSWLDTRTSDKRGADAALAQLDGIKSLEIWPTLGGGQQSMSDDLDRAKLGDPTGIVGWRESFQCSG
jgi:hypothetical protein